MLLLSACTGAQTPAVRSDWHTQNSSLSWPGVGFVSEVGRSAAGELLQILMKRKIRLPAGGR